MHMAWILALAAIGVLGVAHPFVAQAGGVMVADNSSAFSKSAAAPQRLSPPEAAAPKAAQERISQPEPGPSAPVTPDATAPSPSAPHAVYDRPTFQAPEPHGPAQSAPVANVPAPSVPTPSVPAPSVPIPNAPAARPPAASLGAPGIATPAPPTQTALASPYAQQPEFASAERLLDWVSNYRDNPQYWKVPAAVHAMRDHGLFTDKEQRWFCVGFIAGVLGTNPNDGPGLIPKMFPMPAKEQEVIIRAIAYSGRPDWQDLLVKNAAEMPLRKPMIDDFLDGRRPTLQSLELDVGGAPGVYAQWGYYVASGQHAPVMRIMQALKWSKGAQEKGFFGKLTSGWGADANNVDKVTTGGTAKWTLASYAERDRELIGLYRAEVPNQPEEIAKPLNDVIEAAELFEAENIRKEQYGAIEDAQRQQLTADAGLSKGWTAGSIAIATGCMAASALGQAQIAVPCVIGGALYSGAGKLAR